MTIARKKNQRPPDVMESIIKLILTISAKDEGRVRGIFTRQEIDAAVDSDAQNSERQDLNEVENSGIVRLHFESD